MNSLLLAITALGLPSALAQVCGTPIEPANSIQPVVASGYRYGVFARNLTAPRSLQFDNKGNLRGHVYASTGNKLLNDCLVKTMRDLDHSRILAFPADSRVTGFNFRMVWDFGK